MYVENANRALNVGDITVDNLEPHPKNPIIASFFRNIGYADQLGSGVRNLFKYSKFYSGQEPRLVEGDIFRIEVPLDEEYSFDYGKDLKNADKMPISADKVPINADKMPMTKMSEQQRKIFDYLVVQGDITSHQVELLLEVKQRRARVILGEMVDLGIVERHGAYRNTMYKLKKG